MYSIEIIKQLADVKRRNFLKKPTKDLFELINKYIVAAMNV